MEQSNGAKADAGRRYRAYPTPEQAGRLAGWGHSCRAVWNLALEQRQYLYRHRGVTLRANAQCVQLTRARSDLPWLADLPAQSAQQVLRQLDRAYDNWWNPEHPADAPTFKKRMPTLWSRSYFVASVGRVSEATIGRYIAEQTTRPTKGMA